MKLSRYTIVLAVAFLAASAPALCQAQESQSKKPETIASAINGTWSYIEESFVSLADAMPADKYSFAPTSGEFKGVRTFAEQVKHVACANFGFFSEIDGKTPPPDCEHGGPDPAKTKDELMKYLRDSFAYGDKVLNAINAKNALDPTTGRYPGPSTKLGLAFVAVWHASDHYGQMVEYLRMNGLVPPASR